MSELFAWFGSAVDDDTSALVVKSPPGAAGATLTTRVKTCGVATARLGRLHVTGYWPPGWGPWRCTPNRMAA